MWTLLASAVFLSIGYFIGWYLNKPENKPLPYRWTCLHEGCEFFCASDNMNVMLKMADDHVVGHG